MFDISLHVWDSITQVTILGELILELHGYGGRSTYLSTTHDTMANIDKFFPSCPPCATDRDLKDQFK